MDYTTLYQILSQANDENEKASPYAGFNDALGQIGDASISYGAKSGDYKTGIIGALLSGVLGGAGQSLSNSWVADQNDQATDLLSQAISGRTISRPDGMTPSVFSKVQNGGNIWRGQQEVEQLLEEKKAERQIRAQLATKGIVKDENGNWAAAPGAREALQSLEGTADPLVSTALFKTRQGEGLTTEEQMAIAKSPLEVQRVADALDYRDSIQNRYEDRKSFDPTLNRKLFERQGEAERFITKKQNIDVALENFDSSETVAGALLRNVQAGALRDSDAADLQRQIQEAAFAALKPTFPGALSDEERKAMMAVSGGEMSVPIGTIKKIFDRKESSILKDVNSDLSRALEANYQVPLSPIGGAGAAENETKVASPSNQATGSTSYSASDLVSAGYSASDIAALKKQGLVK